MGYHARSSALTLLFTTLAVSCKTPTGAFCDENPDDLACDDTVVSETELWRLELEQLEDGRDNNETFYPKRGTITMRLRLNKTSQPDPTCEGLGYGEVTTFLADVEALPSRLQGAATGMAYGSWNCHGMAATVDLNDGTTYELWRRGGDFHPFTLATGATFDDASHWAAGSRGGLFLLGPEHRFDWGIRQSHVDVLVQNRTARDLEIALESPEFVQSPVGLRYTHPRPECIPREPPGSGSYCPPAPLKYDNVTAGGTGIVSWPAHPARRSIRSCGSGDDVDTGCRQSRYGRRRIRGDLGGIGGGIEILCLLAPDHPDRAQVIIDRGKAECGEGWVRGPYVAAARSRLFMHAGSQAVQDTVTILTHLVDEIAIESTEPAITASVSSGPFCCRDEVVTVTVAPDTPRTDHGLWVIGRNSSDELPVTADTVFLPVYVYQLDLTTAAETLRVAAGTSDTTSLLIESEGVFFDIAFSATDLPSGVLQSVPSFDPSVSNRTRGVASAVTATVSGSAAPGTYDLTLCGTIVNDPLETCHPAPLTVVVPENTLPVATIDSPSDGEEFAGGDDIEFSGSATDAEDGPLSGDDLVWSSHLEGQIGTGSGFARSDLRVGTHTVTLTATDSEGASGSTNVRITIENTRPVAEVSSPADGEQFANGAVIDFSGSATDAEDGTLPGSALTWTSSLDGQIGTGGAFTRSDLSAGTHVITLTATDSGGATGSADVTIEIGAAAGCGDFTLRLDFDPVQVAAGGSDVMAVFVDRAAGFTDQVELLLAPGAGSTQPWEVLSTWAFDPNPVDGGSASSVLSFTVRGDVSAGEEYELRIAGGSPLLETDPEWCTIPITFEVVQ